MDLSELSQNDKEIFKEYLQNHFGAKKEQPEGDETFLEFWEKVILETSKESPALVLNRFVSPSRPVDFKEMESVSIKMYDSTAGKIPVISIKNAEDFENLATNVVHKGVRPENISSTGAAFVCGKSTRFIILSGKPYSNVSAKTLGLEANDWISKSMTIRLEHECTHYWTKRWFGSARNHLHDELIADFSGLFAAFGSYKAEYFEYFMGIKGTEGTRLRCYIPDCSPSLLEILKQTASKAAHWVESWTKTKEFASMTKEERLSFLCSTDLSTMAEINFQ